MPVKILVNPVTGAKRLVATGSPAELARLRAKLTAKPASCCIKPTPPPPKP
jgi:hypothetical protein